MFLLPNITSPEVGLSRPAKQCRRVLFPDPLVPIIAVNLPFSTSNEIPSTAFTILSFFRSISLCY